MCSSCIQGQYNERSLYCPWCIDIASFKFVENRVLIGLHLYTPKSAPGHGLQVVVFELRFAFYSRYRLILLKATGKHVEHIELSETSEWSKILTFCEKH